VGVKFSAPVQIGPGAHPASYKMGTGSFPGVKRPGRGADHPSTSMCVRDGGRLCAHQAALLKLWNAKRTIYRHDNKQTYCQNLFNTDKIQFR
jgi:hypothetical protein